MTGRQSIVYLYSSRTPRTGANIGDCSIADTPVFDANSGKRTAWMGSAWHGTPDGDRYALLYPGEIDAWLQSQGLRLAPEEPING